MTAKRTHAYHFLSATNAVDDLTHRRLKISELDKLNDPFELWCVAQPTPTLRRSLRGFKKELAKKYGIISFTKHWHNPVLWSHYADHHRGICLGFTIPNDKIKPVEYVKQRPALKRPLSITTTQQLLFTKYQDWQYEQELRGCFRIDTPDPSNGRYFYPFDDDLLLTDVIAGPLCTTTQQALTKALKGYPHKVKVTKARLSFTTFQVIKNKKGFRTTHQ